MKTILSMLLFFLVFAISGKEVAGHNADLMEEAFERQMKYLNEWDEHVTETPNAAQNEITLHFSDELKVKDAFTILQTWRKRIENDKEKLKYFVELPIAGKIHPFRIKKDFYKRYQIYITSIHQGLDGMKYEKVFEVLKGINQKEAAEYILEASEAYIDDPRSSKDWEQKYPFLKKLVTVNGNKKSISMSLREILNEIMVIGQVAEAASPPNDDFKRWMETSKREAKNVLDILNKQWKLGVDEALRKRKLKMQMFDYDRLFDLIGDYSAPDLKTEARADLGRHFQPAGNIGHPLSDQIYEDLKDVREKAISLSKTKNSEIIGDAPKGRVPFADEVFRMTLHRIANTRLNSDKLWKEFFDAFFPMYKKGGTQLGRFDIFFNKWIKDYYPKMNAKKVQSFHSSSMIQGLPRQCQIHVHHGCVI